MTVALADLFQIHEKPVSLAHTAQKVHSTVTGARDKVQVIGAVKAL